MRAATNVQTSVIRKIAKLAPLACLLIALPAYASDITGAQWSVVSEDFKMGYTLSFRAGILQWADRDPPPKGDPQYISKGMHWYFADCIKRREISAKQITAMIDTYIMGHQDAKKEPLYYLTTQALNISCGP